jgi:hypothetical protein
MVNTVTEAGDRSTGKRQHAPFVWDGGEVGNEGLSGRHVYCTRLHE